MSIFFRSVAVKPPVSLSTPLSPPYLFLSLSFFPLSHSSLSPTPLSLSLTLPSLLLPSLSYSPLSLTPFSPSPRHLSPFPPSPSLFFLSPFPLSSLYCLLPQSLPPFTVSFPNLFLPLPIPPYFSPTPLTLSSSLPFWAAAPRGVMSYRTEICASICTSVRSVPP